MKMFNNNSTRPDFEVCLCSRCASIYYESKKHYVVRKDLYQYILEPCDICKNPHGYDFLIWDVSSVQNRNLHVCGGRRK